MILPTARSPFVSFGDPLVWAGVAAGVGAQSLAVSPAVLNTAAVTTVTFTGVGTTWNSTPPTFTPTGVSGVTTASRTVIDDTSATLSVTTVGNIGTITWSDSTSTGTCTQIVQFCGVPKPVIAPLPLVYWSDDWR